MIATLSEVVEFDEDGHVDGLQFDGRERAIQEWRDRKEAAEYTQLFERLYQRKWATAARNDPVRRERILENLRRYRTKHRERVRQMERDRRRAKYEADPVINQCKVCGNVWTVPYDRHGPKRAQFCSTKCRNRWHGIRRARRRNRGLRKMDMRPQALRFIRANPGCTAAEVATAIEAKPNSLRVCLKRWADEGVLVRVGKKPMRYWINGNSTGAKQ